MIQQNPHTQGAFVRCISCDELEELGIPFSRLGAYYYDAEFKCKRCDKVNVVTFKRQYNVAETNLKED